MPRSLWILFGILLVDQLDAGMMMPIYPLLFTDADSAELLIARDDVETTGMLWIAILGAAYAVPAFVAQPLIGQLSDRYGRRPLLLASFLSSALSFVLFGLGVTWGALWLLVVARVVDGIAAGNLLVAQASVADMSDAGQRTTYFGYFTGALSLGFVFGPLLGGFLGSPETYSWTGPATAFYFAGALNGLAVLAFYFVFRETLDESDRDDEGEFEVAQSLHNAREAFSDERRRPYYLILLCYIGGYTFFMTFYAVVMEERLDMDAQQTGWYFSAMGLALMLVQVFLVKRLEDWLGASKTLWVAMFAVAGAVVAMGLAQEPWMAYAAILPFALASGLIDPLIMSLLSQSADEDQQGRIQGVRGSVDSLGRTVPPFLAGPIAAAGAANWAVLTGAGVMAVGGVLALRLLGGDASEDEASAKTEGDAGEKRRVGSSEVERANEMGHDARGAREAHQGKVPER